MNVIQIKLDQNINVGSRAYENSWKHRVKIFSFEKDFLEKYYLTEKFMGYESDSDFLDIGIPINYDKFKRNFKTFIS